MANNKRVAFRCPDCWGVLEMFPGCKIQKIFCSYKWSDHAAGTFHYYNTDDTEY